MDYVFVLQSDEFVNQGTWMLFTYTMCTDLKTSLNTDYFVVLIFQAITGWGIGMFFTYTRCTDLKQM